MAEVEGCCGRGCREGLGAGAVGAREMPGGTQPAFMIKNKRKEPEVQGTETLPGGCRCADEHHLVVWPENRVQEVL